MRHRSTPARTVSRLVGALGVVALLATVACSSAGSPTIEGAATTVAPTQTSEGDATDAAGTAGSATEATAPAAGPDTTTAGPGPGAATGGPAGSGGLGAPPLAGLWAGEYKSVVPANADGTFTVVFDGSGSAYTGSIVMAGLCEPDCSITASVTGNTITFGSVGPRAVTYKGTISGDSMSGTYTVGNEGQGEGTWTAVKG